ncbi:MAG: Fe-S cluster assembly protein SufD [Parvularculaceae bacterium]
MASARALSAFEEALAKRAGGLAPSRAQAFDGFIRNGFPNRRTEGWRWSDFRAALGDAAASPAPIHQAAAPLADDLAGLKPIEIRIVNGRIDMRAEKLPDGLRCGVIDAGGGVLELSDHPVATLNAAMTKKSVGIEVAKDTVLAPPIVIRHINDGAGFSFAQSMMRLGERARATVIETFEGAGAAFHSHVFLLALKEGAHFDRAIFSETGPDAIIHSLFASRIEAGATFAMTALSNGARLCRHETLAQVAGAGARVDIATAALLGGDRHNDFTSAIGFHAEGAEARQRHKGVAKEKARNVFQGKFRVLRGAQKTDARMNADALLLSDTSESNAKPELEIYADDVQCAHGSTSGALDERALFYMRQRGLSESAARAMLIEAFVGSTFDAVRHPGIEQAFRHRVAAWLEGV